MQQLLHERALMLRCTQIACFVITEMECAYRAVRTESISVIEA